MAGKLFKGLFLCAVILYGGRGNISLSICRRSLRRISLSAFDLLGGLSALLREPCSHYKAVLCDNGEVLSHAAVGVKNKAGNPRHKTAEYDNADSNKHRYLAFVASGTLIVSRCDDSPQDKSDTRKYAQNKAYYRKNDCELLDFASDIFKHSYFSFL